MAEKTNAKFIKSLIVTNWFDHDVIKEFIARLEAADKENIVLKAAQQSSHERIAELEAGLVDMCCQFAFWSSKGGHWTGGMSALEGAFGLLDWDDPHLAPECCCDEPGCKKQISCGTPSPDGYRNTCWGHKPEASK